ncbi:MAG TPA: hypothetical protein PKB14_21570 [Rubrivivax sp.]|nr:hypothetical protein [Rubrivivax sp.]
MHSIVAGIALAVCVALLLRMLLREPQRRRVDAVFRRALLRGRQLARRAWFWPRHRRHAAREADDAIRRAQRRGSNVVRPDSFKRPRKPH